MPNLPNLYEEPVVVDPAIKSNGEPVNRFMFCTLVWSVAREIHSRARINGESLSFQTIVRDLMRTYWADGMEGRQDPAGLANLLDGEELGGEIDRQFQEYFGQSRARSIEARRLDIESIWAAQDARLKRRGLASR
ncbi:MAG: hypothetical protein ACREEM_45335 [Blastocatellia bacterium]